MGLDNVLYGLAKGWARFRGREPAYILGESELQIVFEKPSKESNGRAWNTDLYSFGCVFAKGKAEPLRFSKENMKLMASDKWKEFMGTKIIKDSFKREGKKQDLLMYGMGLVAVLQMVLIILMGANLA